MMICHFCSKTINDDSYFCDSCGKKVTLKSDVCSTKGILNKDSLIMIVLSIINILIILVVMFGEDEVSLVYAIKYGKMINGFVLILLSILFSISIPLYFDKQVEKLSTIKEFKFSELKLNHGTFLLLGISILLFYFLKTTFFPIVGLFIVIFSCYIYIFKKKNKSMQKDTLIDNDSVQIRNPNIQDVIKVEAAELTKKMGNNNKLLVKLLLTFVAIPILCLIMFGMLILVSKMKLLPPSFKSFHIIDSFIVNIFGMIFWMSPICIWYKKSVKVKTKLRIWAISIGTGIGTGILLSLILGPNNFLPIGISIFVSFAMLRTETQK